MEKYINNRIKFIIGIIIIFLLSLTIFSLYYTITQETFYSADYETTGIVREKEFKVNKWHLEIEYKDSERNERVDKREVSEGSDENKTLKKYNVEVGSKVKIRTEEGFGEGFLGKRFLYSTILEVLDE
ncbi:MAG: hypothetical protein Q3980_06190 [Turicibacter sp.]|nr:hypothetical protein [Turicibacter sp.]